MRAIPFATRRRFAVGEVVVDLCYRGDNERAVSEFAVKDEKVTVLGYDDERPFSAARMLRDETPRPSLVWVRNALGHEYGRDSRYFEAV